MNATATHAGARVLGVRVDAVTLDRAARAILEATRTNRLRSGRGRLWLVVTPNPEIVMAAQSDAELREILNSADLAVADGVGLVWAANRLGSPLPGRVAGFDLLVEVLARGAGEGLRVFLLGARPGVAEAAAARCMAEHPGLVVTGTHHGYFPPDRDDEVAGLVAATSPDLVVTGMGSPRQEKWLARYGKVLAEGSAAGRPGRGGGGRAVPPRPGGQVGMPVGGSLDVLAGRVSRPPAWVARFGLEWAVRVASQPSRWRRAPTLARFVVAVLAEERRARRRQA